MNGKQSAFRATPMPFALDGTLPTAGKLNARGTSATPRLSHVSKDLPAWFSQLQVVSNNGPTQGQPQPQAQQQASAPEVALDMSPRGKHKYPPVRPWTCNDVVGWLGLLAGFTALVLIIIFQLPGRHHGNHGDTDIDRRRGEEAAPREIPHENYVGFRFEAEAGPTRWPKTGVIADLDLEDIVSARLCCVVGTQQYLVCDSSQPMATNLGIAFVVRHETEEKGAHLLITAPSTDMAGSQCIFSWQSRLHQHDKAALVVPKAQDRMAGGGRFAHTPHAGRRGK